jgi:hypothetical protein
MMLYFLLLAIYFWVVVGWLVGNGGSGADAD